jgi:xanthine dehydrogenase small subunit
MRDRIHFYLNGKEIEASGDDAFLTVAEFLRRRRGLTGTKVVCAEGDCGSCAVLIGRPEGGRMRYSAVTSCIQSVFQLDAAHLVTVEGLRHGAALSPIQQAMVACQGTQCGFCTPGFVVALQDLMNDGETIDAEKVRRGLTGNLCRCTGYDSIIRSALECDRPTFRSLEELYPSSEMLNDLTAAAMDPVLVATPTRKAYKPVSLEQAVRFKLENSGCSVIAGATDLGVVCNKRLREITVALTLSGIASLREVRIEPDAITLGAGTTLTTLQAVSREYLPELGRFMEWFGSPLIRNAGTIGGNLVTASPIGDTIPAMIALGAEVELTGTAGSRRVPIGQFYTGYRTTVLADHELVTSVRIPRLAERQILKLYKVSRRKDLDISGFNAAIWLQRSNGIVEELRLAFGGVGPMVLRLPRAEAVLRGKYPTLERFEQAGEVAREEITPIDDVRGSADYRRCLARNIFSKFWHEVMS